MASIRNMVRAFALTGALAALAMAPLGAVAGVDLPALEKGKGEKCVEDTPFMRRNHMELLKHHRNETMHKGIRTTRYSLKGCVECHASSKTGSVAASEQDFCAACHSYASVKLDCWDCHATKPAKPKAAAQATASQPALNLMPSVQTGGQAQ